MTVYNEAHVDKFLGDTMEDGIVRNSFIRICCIIQEQKQLTAEDRIVRKLFH
jgi:hypothetical protein